MPRYEVQWIVKGSATVDADNHATALEQASDALEAALMPLEMEYHVINYTL